MANWESMIQVESDVSNGAVANSSTVRFSFYIRRTDYKPYGYCNDGAAYWNITCDGVGSTGNIQRNFTWNMAQNEWWNVGYTDFTVPHNADGSKYITFSGYFDTGGITPASFGANGSATLVKIPRYSAISSWSNTDITQNTATFSWSTDSTCDWARVYVNNSSAWRDVWNGSATNGTFTYLDILPNTTYNIKIEVRRKDSQLWTMSNNIQFKTNPYATITNVLSMNIGGSLPITFKDFTYSNSSLKIYGKNTSGTWINLANIAESLQQETYSWNLSSIASTMYSLCPTSNTLELKIECGTTINNVAYTSTYYGTANVINSNPTFFNYTFANTDSVINALTGSNQYMITNYGNLRVTILATNKMTTLNSATGSYYAVSYLVGGVETVLTNITYAATDLNVDIGKLAVSGTYTIKITAVDSRGNMSSVVSKTFTTLMYQAPSISATLLRVNGFEKETTLNLTAYISRVLISTVAKNTLVSLKYQVKYAGGAFGDLIDVPITTNATDTNTNFIKITCVKPDTANKFIDLTSDISWEVKFIVTDKYTNYDVTVPVGQGTPLFNVIDDGHVTVGVTPDAIMFAEGTKFQVQGDIAVRDSSGNYKKLLQELNTTNATLNTLLTDLTTNSALKKAMYLVDHPIGDLVFNISGVNPGTKYGGTWISWGAGRVPVGVYTPQTEFNTVEKAGGEAYHVLAYTEMPAHAHNLRSQSGDYAGAGWNDRGYMRANSDAYTNYNTSNISVEGGGQAHNNLQPYLTCYMWKRTV